MVAKIKAACDARHDPEFVIIARTDAIAVEGLDAALDHGERYREAGADMLFSESPVGRGEVERVVKHFKGVPLLYNTAASGKTLDLPAGEFSGSTSVTACPRTSAWVFRPLADEAAKAAKLCVSAFEIAK